MAILGLGTDIVEIARIEAVIARSGDRLARRVLSEGIRSTATYTRW